MRSSIDPLVAVVLGLGLATGASACFIDDEPYRATDAGVGGMIVLAQPVVSVPEGGTSPVGLTLASAPPGPVVVAVASTGVAQLQAIPASVVFDPSSYAVPHVVTVSASHDVDTVDGAASIIFTADSYPPATAMVTVVDDDEQQIAASPSPANTLDVPELGMVNIFVTLAYQPAGEVSVLVTAGGEAINFGPSILTFSPSNYAQIQSLYIQGEDDADTTDDPGTIALSANGLATITYTVNVVDAN